GHAQEVWALQFDRNKLISGSCDKTVRIWEEEKRRVWKCRAVLSDRERLGPVLCLQFDQRKLVTGSHDSTAVVWDFDIDDERLDDDEDDEVDEEGPDQSQAITAEELVVEGMTPTPLPNARRKAPETLDERTRASETEEDTATQRP